MEAQLRRRRYHRDPHHRPSLACYRVVRIVMRKTSKIRASMRMSTVLTRVCERTYLATFDILIVFLANALEGAMEYRRICTDRWYIPLTRFVWL